jgi:hypothetical protein
MATLVSLYNSDGCIGRCDARCYNATGRKCECICDGRNHGRGLAIARETTEREWEQWVARRTPSDDPASVWFRLGTGLVALPLVAE